MRAEARQMRGPVDDSGADNAAGAERFFALQFTTGPMQVRAALEELRACLAAWAMPGDLIEAAEIVMAEVFNNIEEHAYGAKNSGPIWVSFLALARKLVVTVSDQGQAPPEDLIRGKCLADIVPEALPEGGFGWALIRDLVHDLRIFRRDGVTHLSFTLTFVPERIRPPYSKGGKK